MKGRYKYRIVTEFTDGSWLPTLEKYAKKLSADGVSCHLEVDDTEAENLDRFFVEGEEVTDD